MNLLIRSQMLYPIELRVQPRGENLQAVPRQGKWEFGRVLTTKHAKYAKRPPRGKIWVMITRRTLQHICIADQNPAAVGQLLVNSESESGATFGFTTLQGRGSNGQMVPAIRQIA